MEEAEWHAEEEPVVKGEPLAVRDGPREAEALPEKRSMSGRMEGDALVETESVEVVASSAELFVLVTLVLEGEGLALDDPEEDSVALLTEEFVKSRAELFVLEEEEVRLGDPEEVAVREGLAESMGDPEEDGVREEVADSEALEEPVLENRAVAESEEVG